MQSNGRMSEGESSLTFWPGKSRSMTMPWMAGEATCLSGAMPMKFCLYNPFFLALQTFALHWFTSMSEHGQGGSSPISAEQTRLSP